ncbi:MAG: GTPase Era [Alphaproteobacteria bacterium]|nr:GTPase Era [Alphaproteobacteria bacterium]MBL0717667.1 GTPase Era [Alphaproteobacteria bacterium]
MKTKAGIITLLGPTNAGKSTLINKLIGEKISIVSHKVQTSRFLIRAILNKKTKEFNSQMVFVDTPGIFSPSSKLDQSMVSTAWGAIQESNIVLLVVDVNKGITDTIKLLTRNLNSQKIEVPIFLALNKVDRVKKDKLISIVQEFMDLYKFDEVFMISALKGTNIEKTVNTIVDNLPEQDFISTQEDAFKTPLKFYCAEITREKVYKFFHQELPYSTSVVTDLIEDSEDKKRLIIHQTIFVEKNSQKRIIVGKAGSGIKKIGIDSRLELQSILNKKIQLLLFVKVDPKWVDKNQSLVSWDKSSFEF